MKFCCQELERHVQAPKDTDEFIISPAGMDDPSSTELHWFIYDKQDKDTYPMDECVFCGTVLK
jgi:hypothetical protein